MEHLKVIVHLRTISLFEISNCHVFIRLIFISSSKIKQIKVGYLTDCLHTITYQIIYSKFKHCLKNAFTFSNVYLYLRIKKEFSDN